MLVPKAPLLCSEAFGKSLLFISHRTSKTKAITESIMIGDSVTRPLTNDPIHGYIASKMKGSASAGNSERNVNTIGTRKNFLLIRNVKAIDVRVKMDVLTIMV